MKLFSVNTTDGKQHWFSAGYKAKRFLIDFNKDAKTKEIERKKLRDLHEDRPWDESSEEPSTTFADKEVHEHDVSGGKEGIIDFLNKKANRRK